MTKPVSMDIDQLRGWAAFMDRAVIVSLVATLMAVAALGVTTWLSFRFSSAVRAHERAALDLYKGKETHSRQLEQDIAAARERAVALEREVSTARARTAALEQEVSAARERAVVLEQETSTARERAVAFEQAAREANERAARAPREAAAASEKARTPLFDAAEIQRRVADLAKLVREATARAAPTQGRAAETPPPAHPESTPESVTESREAPASPVVSSLRKHAGTKAAVFVLDQVADAPAAGSAISSYLGDAGWASETWTWSRVAGIVGVVVLVKEGSDLATHEAASTLVEALRAAGFNATKGDWPAGAGWHRFRGVLDGPQTPGPTDAPLRIVVGAKAR
jgi:hypothetical protein